jgi:hypothetical protein
MGASGDQGMDRQIALANESMSPERAMYRTIALFQAFARGRRSALGTLTLGVLFGLASMFIGAMAQVPPLVPDASIALPDTAGRIDHMAIDLSRKHLFVVELGNGSLDVVDLASGKVIHRIADLKEPQGIGYDPKSDLVVVASGGDGTLRSFSGGDFAPRGVLALGDDADNLRIDPRNGHVIVGYGGGALAIIDPQTMRKLQEIPLAAHPESFRLSGSRVFVNVPDAGQIVVADVDSAKVIAIWKLRFSSNFPMILDDSGGVGIVFRGQSKLALLDANSGAVIASADTCGDADDIYFDARRKYFYVSCGSGTVDVVSRDPGGLHSLSRIRTSLGARTSLFVPEFDRLFVAGRAGILRSTASIWVFRTSPN